MKTQFALIILAAMGLSCANALAASAAPESVAANALGGSAVAGVCLLSPEAVISASKVGQATNSRLQTLAQGAQAKLDAERSPIAADMKAFAAQKASLPAAQAEQQQQALNQRVANLQAESDQLSRELSATRNKALGKIDEALQPLVATAYAQHSCGLLIRREAALGGNLANDLTPAVTQALDSRLTALPPFERETLAAASPATGVSRP